MPLFDWQFTSCVEIARVILTVKGKYRQSVIIRKGIYLQQFMTEVLLQRSEFYVGMYNEFLQDLSLGGRA